MNKIKFDGRVLDLYSEDYEYLQNEVEEEIRKTLRQILKTPDIAAVIKGFKLKVSPSDSSKIMVYHDGEWSSAIDSVGRLVETSENIDLVEASDNTSGTINYVYVHSSTGYGSYNKRTELVEAGEQKNIDYYTYTNVYDRETDVWEIVVYTQAEVLALSSAEYAKLIPLGYFVANGANPIATISEAGRAQVQTFIADDSITTEMISNLYMLLPQENVDNSEVINDTYSGTPATLEDDLNKIRTVIRLIRGSEEWDGDDPNNLRVFDASINALHSNGVLANVRDEMSVVPNSTGLSVIVETGKTLINGVIQSIITDTRQTLTIDPQPAYSKSGEIHTTGVVGSTFRLNYGGICTFVTFP